MPTLHRLLATAALALFCPMAGVAAVSEPMVDKLFYRDAPIDLVLKQLTDWTGKKITVPADVPLGRFTCNIIVGTPTSRSELVALFRDYIEKQAGVVFDEQPDGSWQARLIARNRDPKAVGLIFKHAEVQAGLSTLAEYASGKKLDASPGVLKSGASLDLAVFAASRSQAISLLRDVLETQAGIVTKDLPDGTLQLRLKTGDNDPVIAALDFTDTPVLEVLTKLEEITSKQVWRHFHGSPTSTGSDHELLAGRSLTLHLKNQPTSQAYALLRDTLEKQAEVVLTETPDGLGITAQLTPAAAEILPRTLDFKDTQVIWVLNYLGAWTGKNIVSEKNVQQASGKVTLAFKAIPTKQAIAMLRDALQQQAGVELIESPDGNFTARLLVKPEPFNASPAVAPKS